RHGEWGTVLPFDRDHADVHTREKGLPFVFAHAQVHARRVPTRPLQCSRRTSQDGESDHASQAVACHRYLRRMTEFSRRGFEVVATFRTPHVTIAFDDAPADAITRLLGLD